ncbi:gas vesicle protein, partial [Xanthomonas oryzae pv. oryzae]
MCVASNASSNLLRECNMTDQDQNQPSLEDVKLAFDGQSVDWYLQKLVGIANTSNVQFGVTLFLEGIV